MQLQLTFENRQKTAIIPINYQRGISAWIYKTIENSNPEFSDWLHNNGYMSGTKRFKLFTFSKLVIPQNGYTLYTDRFIISAPELQLTVSFLLPEQAEHFVVGIFKESVCTLVDTNSSANFKVVRLERVPEPIWDETMIWRTASAILVSKPEERNGKLNHVYIHPDEPEYEHYFIQNLISTYSAVPGNSPDKYTANQCKLSILTEPYRKGILLKTKVIAYEFEFKLLAPVELQKVGYYAGFGKSNAMGLGNVVNAVSG